MKARMERMFAGIRGCLCMIRKRRMRDDFRSSGCNKNLGCEELEDSSTGNRIEGLFTQKIYRADRRALNPELC